MSALKARSVRCFELFKSDGTSMGIFRVESTWQGMRCLESLDGKEKLVVDVMDGIFGALFDDILGIGTSDLTVVKGSPGILAALKETK